jgi:hypothetical protein
MTFDPMALDNEVFSVLLFSLFSLSPCSPSLPVLGGERGEQEKERESGRTGRAGEQNGECRVLINPRSKAILETFSH